MPNSEPDAAVAAMQSYYAQRAAVYERVYHKPERQTDLRAIESWLPAQFAGRHVLEIACGTGWWTPFGARDCAHWLATDVNPETMAIARGKSLPAGKVEFAVCDAYQLGGLQERHFDAAFAGCWWSHVPLGRLANWLDRLHSRLASGARIVMIDNRYVDGNSTPLSRRDAEGNSYQQRTLDDGSAHEVLKNYPSSKQAFAALGARARSPRWTDHAHFWVLDYALA